MLYKITRPFATLTLSIFFRKIYFSNADVVPKNAPVILATNHPTAFLEPCIFACFLSRPLHFLVRGDFFSKPLYRAILMDWNMIPIYRRKDMGYKGLKNNFSSLDYCYDLLHQNKVIHILAEGSSIHEKRLRNIQKGTARIAFGAYEKHKLANIVVVPAGVNYTYADRPREEVMITFGTPLFLKDYLDAYHENPNKGIQRLTKDLSAELLTNVIHIENKADETLVEQLFILHRHDQLRPVFPIISTDGKPLQQEKQIANWINQMEEEKKIELRKKAQTYFQQLQEYKINDLSVAQPGYRNVGNIIPLLLGFPFFVIGYIFNSPPVLLGKFIGDKYIKYVEYYTSVVVSTTMAFYILYFIFWLLLLLFQQEWKGILVLFLMPSIGFFALLYKQYFEDWWGRIRLSQLPLEIRRDLHFKRKTIFE